MDVAVRSVGTLPVTMNRLSQAGIKLSEGSLHFDETAFRQAMEENPAAVTELFAQEVTNADGTKTVTGLAGVIKTEINHLATDEAGVIPLQEETLQSSEDLLNERISQMQTLLARRRESLLSQFYFMEQTIAKLQSQQTALNSHGTLLTSLMNYATGSNSSSSSSSSSSTSTSS